MTYHEVVRRALVVALRSLFSAPSIVKFVTNAFTVISCKTNKDIRDMLAQVSLELKKNVLNPQFAGIFRSFTNFDSHSGNWMHEVFGSLIGSLFFSDRMTLENLVRLWNFICQQHYPKNALIGLLLTYAIKCILYYFWNLLF